MKIISGKLKGRTVEGDSILGTRPTMDRIKESLFAMIQDKLEASSILDLFAGSGNLGLEALSNGASSCVFVDHNPKAIQTIKRNIRTLGLQELSTIYLQDAFKALNYLKGTSFSLIFLDPPYQAGLLKSIIAKIIENDLLTKDGILICEVAKDTFSYEEDDLFLWKSRRYGDKEVYLYTRK